LAAITPVIMAGGAGTRLWPLSRADYPKQFLALNGENTMLQETVMRLKNFHLESIVTVCNEDHRFFVAEQLRDIGREGTIILEPVARNTAPAIALAALSIKSDNSLMLVLPADHIIKDISTFEESIEKAIPLAQSNKLVTFGITPNSPHNGYGYIKSGKAIDEGYLIDSFKEKLVKRLLNSI